MEEKILPQDEKEKFEHTKSSKLEVSHKKI